MKQLAAALLLTTGLVFAGSALAQEKLDKVVRVGALGDQSGLYQDIGGPGSTVAAQMAIEDLRIVGQRLEDRCDLGRSPEQARCRRQHRQEMDR